MSRTILQLSFEALALRTSVQRSDFIGMFSGRLTPQRCRADDRFKTRKPSMRLQQDDPCVNEGRALAGLSTRNGAYDEKLPALLPAGYTYRRG
ncbi:hypothetical protein Efla_001370 [Eimeria flavescens]